MPRDNIERAIKRGAGSKQPRQISTNIVEVGDLETARSVLKLLESLG